MRLVPVALTFALTLALAACGGGNDAPAGNAAQGQPAAAAGDAERVTSEITGAGATFIFPLISRWAVDYKVATGNRVNYQSIGSGGGIAQIKAGTVDFGSSDKPVSRQELAEAGLLQFPSAIGGVVPVVNIQGVAPGQLRLNGPVLADIFMGKVTTWNAPAITALNPGVALPGDKINIVRRSDGSGTTFNLSNYLSKVSPTWQSSMGEGTSLEWKGGVGGKGNEGVASYVKQLAGSIGYVELSYALQNKMSHVQLQNAAGNFVQPGAASFQAAAAGADWANAKDFNLVITNAAAPDAWPIAATNFILMHKQPKDAARSKAARDFFAWALANGQPQAQALDFVPLPPPLVEKVKAYWGSEFK